MAKKNMTVEDFANDGFTVYHEAPKAKVAAPILTTPVVKKQANSVETPETKIVIMDNKEVLRAVEASNAVLKEELGRLINSLGSLGNRPDSFTLDITRDGYGAMKSIKVKIDK